MKEMIEGLNPWNGIIKNLQPNGEVNVGGIYRWPNTPVEGEINPERFRVNKIKGIMETGDPTINPEYKIITSWMSDPEVRRHLRPPIPSITLANLDDLPEALKELDRYYHNRNRRDENGEIIYDKPEKITPLIALNGLDEPIATLVIRWKGDPFAGLADKNKGNIKNGSIQSKDKKTKIAAIENIIVDPNLQSKHIATTLMAAALDIIFYQYKDYAGKSSADAVRLWIFTDPQAGDYSRNINLVQNLGFRDRGLKEGGTWKEYAELRGIPNPGGRHGMQFELTKEGWERTLAEDAEKEYPRLMLPPDAIDKTSLRIPRLSNGKIS